MARYYSPTDCRRKANQHWEMAGLARQDNDQADSKRHTDLARLWDQRAAEGGWSDG
jgi:hypothetical protein